MASSRNSSTNSSICTSSFFNTSNRRRFSTYPILPLSLQDIVILTNHLNYFKPYHTYSRNCSNSRNRPKKNHRPIHTEPAGCYNNKTRFRTTGTNIIPPTNACLIQGPFIPNSRRCDSLPPSQPRSANNRLTHTPNTVINKMPNSSKHRTLRSPIPIRILFKRRNSRILNTLTI